MRTIVVMQVLMVCCLAAPAVAAPVEAVALPEAWRFQLDPADVGVKQEWFAPGLKDDAWKTVSTHKWIGWDKQGFGKEKGYAWYRLAWKVPATLDKKHVYLFFCGVGDAATIRVNGQAVGEHAFSTGGDGLPSWIKPFHFDVTSKLRFGETNQFTVRVRNVTRSAPGIWKPVYLFAGDKPLSHDEMRERAKRLNHQVLAARNPRVLYDVWTTYAYDPVFPHSKPPQGEAAIVQTEAPAAEARSFIKAVRLWAWVDRGRNAYGYLKPTGETAAPVVAIDGLVPGETCKVTLVFAGPEGQQRVITRKITTRGWGP